MTSGTPENPTVGHLLRARLQGRAARRAWDHLEPGFVAKGYLPDKAGWLAFWALCVMWSIYRDVERLASEGRQSREVERAVAECRLRMRAKAAEWYLLPVARVPLAQVNARGEDVELKRIFGCARGARRRTTAGAFNVLAATGPFGECDRPISTTTRRHRR